MFVCLPFCDKWKRDNIKFCSNVPLKKPINVCFYTQYHILSQNIVLYLLNVTEWILIAHTHKAHITTKTYQFSLNFDETHFGVTIQLHMPIYVVGLNCYLVFL